MAQTTSDPTKPQANRLCLLIPIIVLVILYAFRSFVLYVDIMNPVGLEECHTGAAAREIIKHGFQFPIEQYTPEYYENSILVEILMTVVSARLIGLNRLSLEIVPFLFSLATLLVFCSLLMRGGFKKGLWFFIISYFFASTMFFYTTMDSVGNHIIGLLVGVINVLLFHKGYVSRNPRYFYVMMFFTGLGLFIHLGSLLYSGLCLPVFLLYKPVAGSRPRLSTSTIVKGALIFLIGSCPFIVFLLKTKLMSVKFLLQVASERNSGILDLISYSMKTFEQLLFQFDGRAWLIVFYYSFILFAWALWIKLRNNHLPEEKRLMLYITCFFQAPVFLAVTLFSGGGFTLYFTYMFPLLFMAGAVVAAHLTERYFPSGTSSAAIQIALSVSLLTVLLTGPHAKHFNLSTVHAYRKLTSNENLAYCYWRFGRAFTNYHPYKDDAGKHASDILSVCGRFDSVKKQDECIWGWCLPQETSFMFDPQATEILGPKASSLLARSVGAGKRKIENCLEVGEKYADDCILGFIEKNVIHTYSIRLESAPHARIPCSDGSPGFSGFVGEMRKQLQEKTSHNRPQTCPDNLKELCIQVDAYCAAVENRIDFCDSSYSSKNDRSTCHFVFQNVRNARKIKKNQNYNIMDR